jgi:hypothetical protein|nr:N-acetylmuramoyl-L-alanine amidase [Kofleriaceae bacterium]
MGTLRAAGLFLVSAAACGSVAALPADPVARELAAAADDAGVPRELIAAIAAEEGGNKLPAVRVVDANDNVHVAGRLELRRGRLDTLALGARLVGASEAELEATTALGTRAGALVVASLGSATGATSDLATWRAALEQLSGMADGDARAYASRVLARLGVASPAPDDAPRARPAGAKGYAGAIWFDTSCDGKCDVGRPLGNASVDKLVIHDTEGDWDASVATLQYDAGKSVHYIVDADGSRVGQFRSETDTTWHAGNYFYNETSIGIEHVGFAANPDGYRDGLYQASEKLVADIETRWTIPLDRTHVVGHYQVPNGDVTSEDAAPCTAQLDSCENDDGFGGADNHRDPGERWQWCQYMQALGGSCTCNDAWPLWNCTTDLRDAVRCTNGQVEIEACTAGCTVEAIGVDDDCAVEAIGGSGVGTRPVGFGGSDGGPGGGGGGCGVGGGAGSPLALALGLGFGLWLRRRWRRRDQSSI